MYLSINNSLTQAGFKLTDTQLVIARDGQGFRFKWRDWSIDTNTVIPLVKRSRKSRPSLPIAADLSSSTHMSLLDTHSDSQSRRCNAETYRVSHIGGILAVVLYHNFIPGLLRISYQFFHSNIEHYYVILLLLLVVV